MTRESCPALFDGVRTVMYSGYDYEEYCCRYLKKCGYKHIRQTQRAKDHGVDIIATKRRKKYAFQCKYYEKNVGNRAVQEAYTGCSYYECDVPVVITNAGFTKNAIHEAQTLGVELISGVDIKRRHHYVRWMVTCMLLVALFACMPQEWRHFLDGKFEDLLENSRFVGILLDLVLVTAAVLAVRGYMIVFGRKRNEDMEDDEIEDDDAESDEIEEGDDGGVSEIDDDDENVSGIEDEDADVSDNEDDDADSDGIIDDAASEPEDNDDSGEI